LPEVDAKSHISEKEEKKSREANRKHVKQDNETPSIPAKEPDRFMREV